MSEAENIHGCAVRVGDLGILVRGGARSGKSSLCLSTLRRGSAVGVATQLVADDRVLLRERDGAVVMAPHPRLAGLIEISGVGIIREPHVEEARLGLVVDLDDLVAIERLPQEHRVPILGVPVRRILLPRRSAAFGADVLVSLAMADARVAAAQRTG